MKLLNGTLAASSVLLGLSFLASAPALAQNHVKSAGAHQSAGRKLQQLVYVDADDGSVGGKVVDFAAVALKRMKDLLAASDVFNKTAIPLVGNDDSYFLVVDQNRRREVDGSIHNSFSVRNADSEQLQPLSGNPLFVVNPRELLLWTSNNQHIVVDGSNPENVLGKIKVKSKTRISNPTPYVTLTQEKVDQEGDGKQKKDKTFVTIAKIGAWKNAFSTESQRQAVLYHHSKYRTGWRKGMKQDDGSLLISQDAEGDDVTLLPSQQRRQKGNRPFTFTITNAKSNTPVGMIARFFIPQGDHTITRLQENLERRRTIWRSKQLNADYQPVYIVYIAPNFESNIGGKSITKDQLSLEMTAAAMAMDAFYPMKKQGFFKTLSQGNAAEKREALYGVLQDGAGVAGATFFGGVLGLAGAGAAGAAF